MVSELQKCAQCGAIILDKDAGCSVCSYKETSSKLDESLDEPKAETPQAVRMINKQIRICRTEQNALARQLRHRDELPFEDAKKRTELVAKMSASIASLFREWGKYQSDEAKKLNSLTPEQRMALFVQWFRRLQRPQMDALLERLIEERNERAKNRRVPPWRQRQQQQARVPGSIAGGSESD